MPGDQSCFVFVSESFLAFEYILPRNLRFRTKISSYGTTEVLQYIYIVPKNGARISQSDYNDVAIITSFRDNSLVTWLSKSLFRPTKKKASKYGITGHLWRESKSELLDSRHIAAVMPNMMTSSNGNIFRVTGPLCGEFIGPGEFPTQRPVTRSFDVFCDQRPNERLSKQSWDWWFETHSSPLWRHSNELFRCHHSTLWMMAMCQVWRWDQEPRVYVVDVTMVTENTHSISI